MSTPAKGRETVASSERAATAGSHWSVHARLLAEHRDDGVLAGRWPTGLVPGPESAWLTLAVFLALAAPSVGSFGPSWSWVAIGSAVAAVGSCGRGWPRLRWPVPALLRALEYGAVLLLAGGSAWTYALLSVLAFHHYDIVYRLRLRGEGPPRWLGIVTGGWLVRIGVIAAAAAAARVELATVVLSLLLAPAYLIESITSWIAPRRASAGR